MCLTGGELFDLIVERGHLTERDAAVKARALLEVIQHCHSRCGTRLPEFLFISLPQFLFISSMPRFQLPCPCNAEQSSTPLPGADHFLPPCAAHRGSAG